MKASTRAWVSPLGYGLAAIMFGTLAAIDVLLFPETALKYPGFLWPVGEELFALGLAYFAGYCRVFWRDAAKWEKWAAPPVYPAHGHRRGLIKWG